MKNINWTKEATKAVKRSIKRGNRSPMGYLKVNFASVLTEAQMQAIVETLWLKEDLKWKLF